MNILAIDLVLLPPHEIIRSIVELNNNIIDPKANSLILGVEFCIPHITIRMGLVEKENLKNIVRQFQAIPLPSKIKINSLQKTKQKEGLYRFLLQITKDEALLKYHKEVMNIQGFLKVKAKSCHFYGAHAIKSSSINYVTNFANNYAKKNYNPHITLGKGLNIPAIQIPEFAPSPAVFQLGNGCTCVHQIY